LLLGEESLMILGTRRPNSRRFPQRWSVLIIPYYLFIASLILLGVSRLNLDPTRV
jgi:hypothetical protein